MRANAGLLGIVIISIAVFIALFVGLISAVLPWWLAVGLFLPPLMIWAGAKWPFVAMVITLMTAYGFLPFGLLAADMVVMGFVAFMLFVYRSNIVKTFETFWQLWLSLAILMFWGLVMIVYGYFFKRNPIEYVYSEALSLAYWMLMVPILLIAKDKKTATYTWYVLIGVSCVLCIVAILQSVFLLKLNFSGLGAVAELTSEEGGVAGLARSSVPGIVTVIFLFILSLVNLINDGKNKWVWCLFLILSSVAIFVTFGRAVWAGTFLAALLAAMFAGPKPFLRFLVFGGVSAGLIIVSLAIFKPDIVISIGNRILSVDTELSGRGTSYQWRVVENHFALMKMSAYPFFGLGLGGEYKPRLIDFRAFTAQTHYIHNGFYYITLKLGLIGLFFYLMNFFNIIRISFVNRSAQGVDSNPQYALMATFLCTLMLNVTQPEFMQGASVAALASVAAVVISLGHWQRVSSAQKPSA